MSTSIHTACPNIVPQTELVLDVNTPVAYRCSDGTEYVFYDHRDPDGHMSRVQFCRRIGRKRDVFQCLNESEWQHCPARRAGS